ncbi:MAG TPA: zinc-binding alcohol dehydrogenase family protein [Polyangiaceae bacterium]|nr:zinc-binding alcohol dehydrogenase family protein [Polyangiaceae bacterium]
MKAAVVHAFDAPPRFAEFREPVAGANEVVVEVKAAALSNLVRILAAGKHPAAVPPPFVPGVDGVGTVDGRRVYFAFPSPPCGSMAELTAVPRGQCVAVPDGVSDITVAAAANPGMSSWASLTRRARLVRGESVLVNGGTGAAGRLAIQVAKHLGARRVVATARSAAAQAELRALGADAVIVLPGSQAELIELFRRELREHGIDVVLDYLFGNTAEAFLHACIGPGRGAAEPRVRFVQIGTMAGPTISLPAVALRSSGVEMLGTGLGSVSHAELVACIGEFFASYEAAGFRIAATSAALSDVESAWGATVKERLVLVV